MDEGVLQVLVDIHQAHRPEMSKERETVSDDVADGEAYTDEDVEVSADAEE